MTIRLPVIGIVGGIGSGKSSVARQLAKSRALLILDGDRVGHEQLQNETVQKEIRSRFGNDVFDETGTVVRAKLGQLVFGDTDENHTALADLESILHPRIREQFFREIENANQSKTVEAVVLDAALLLEAGWQQLCSAVVFIDTPYETRRQRVMENRGWVDGELEKREANQISIEEKKQRSNYILDNSGTLAAAATSLDDILNQILKTASTPNTSKESTS